MRIIIALTLLAQFASSVYAQGNTVSLSLGDIQQYALQNAPRAKIIQNEFKKESTESRASLQWRNPEFEFEIERLSNDVGDERETMVMVGKDITMPWVHAQHKSVRKEHVSSVEAKRDAELRFLIAELKSNYVDLQIINNKRERLSRLETVIDNASQYAAEQYNEGMISDLQLQLIQLSLMHVSGSLMSLHQQKRQFAAQFKTDLGITEEQAVELTTHIDFIPPDPSRIESLLPQLEQNPEYQAHLHKQESLKKKIALEKLSIVPEMHIAGGYKEAGEDFKGYMIGVSVPLPVFDRNRPEVERSRIEYESALIDFEVYKQQLNRQIDQYRHSIDEFTSFFRTNRATFHKVDDMMENSVFSFQEGFLNMSDLINGIMMYQETIHNYYEHLALYYHTVFTLEALIGETIVSL